MMMMMRHEKKLWCVAAAAGCVLSATFVHAYTYNYGPNYVNMSGARCRAETSALGDNLTYSHGRVTVNSGTSTRRLLCPLQRRNTTYYGDLSGSNIDRKVKVENIYLRAVDQHSFRSLSCFAFASAIGSGSVWMDTTRYLCSTTDGCGQAPAGSWVGENSIYIPNPFGFAGRESLSWGFACDVPGNSTLYYSDSAVSSNNTF